MSFDKEKKKFIVNILVEFDIYSKEYFKSMDEESFLIYCKKFFHERYIILEKLKSINFQPTKESITAFFLISRIYSLTKRGQPSFYFSWKISDLKERYRALLIEMISNQTGNPVEYYYNWEVHVLENRFECLKEKSN